MSQILEKSPVWQCQRILFKNPVSGSRWEWFPKFTWFFIFHGYIW